MVVEHVMDRHEPLERGDHGQPLNSQRWHRPQQGRKDDLAAKSVAPFQLITARTSPLPLGLAAAPCAGVVFPIGDVCCRLKDTNE
jgi:hypothetical protein